MKSLDALNSLLNANRAETLSNGLEKGIEDNFEDDRPEFTNTAHFDFVTSFERWIEPNMCARHESFLPSFRL